MLQIATSAVATAAMSTAIFVGLGDAINTATFEAKEPVVEEVEVVLTYKTFIDQMVEGVVEDAIKEEAKTPEIVGKTATSWTSCEDYKDIIESYDWQDEIAMAVCAAESGGNAQITNQELHTDAGCSGSHGLFQVACVHGYSKEVLYNPAENIRIAYSLWEQSGWNPWGVCHDGKISCF